MSSVNLTSLEATPSSYRADIDGLRALAVLSVVLYHAFPKILKGGFIGVDVFFVISGYLITSIILTDLNEQRFSLTKFYSRRIRRIFPALVLVLITSFAVGYVFLLPAEFKQLGKHIAASSGFISNFILWQEAGYFDNAAETKPLLHLWSLGIEEQFYIVWPLLLLFLYKTRLNRPTLIIFLLVGSFMLNTATASTGNLVADFYSPLTRFWELLLGVVLAHFPRENPKRLCFELGVNRWLNRIAFAGPEKQQMILPNLLSIVGMALVVIGLCLITKKTPFPSYWALLSVIGAFFLIAAGADAWINRQILSNRLFVGIGLISYPLYLWHWPLLSFARIIGGETPPWYFQGGMVGLSILLAILTYRLVEKPIRFGRHPKIKTNTLIFLMVIIGFVGFSTDARDGLSFRFPTGAAELAEYKFDIEAEWRQGKCFLVNDQSYKDFALCPSVIDKNKKTIFLWGDSHAASLYPGLRSELSNEFNLIQRTASGCPPIVGLNSKQSPIPNCDGINIQVLNELKKTNPWMVIIAARWVDYLDYKKIEETIKLLNKAKINNIILVGQIPLWKESLPNLLVKKMQQNIAHEIPKRLKNELKDNFELLGIKKEFFEQEHEMGLFFSTLQSKYMSPTKFLCNDEGCLTMLGESADSMTAFDNGHLTAKASQYIIRAMFRDKNLIGG